MIKEGYQALLKVQDKRTPFFMVVLTQFIPYIIRQKMIIIRIEKNKVSGVLPTSMLPMLSARFKAAAPFQGGAVMASSILIFI